MDPERAPGPAGRSDPGMTTVEYTLGTVVAAAFALVLLNVIEDGKVLKAINDLILGAINSAT
ncbi:DUF4244 domain-containing protein [Actinokineospora bangkokensis]|uniref:DUF4244 domain-containing protein n=1 Tax=Actinokineospora bangkokensis TaxID=1193682 RepID=UPI0022B86572|nr:DUF4244 domain-containing protein [Actinokineospora bangkokensis]